MIRGYFLGLLVERNRRIEMALVPEEVPDGKRFVDRLPLPPQRYGLLKALVPLFTIPCRVRKEAVVKMSVRY